MAFDNQQCDNQVPGPLMQLIDEWADNSEVYNLFWVGMEVTGPPFPQNVQDNQAVYKYQQLEVNMVPIAALHVVQKLKKTCRFCTGMLEGPPL